MKILLLNQAFYPDSVATAQHSTDLARFLVDNGHTVTVVTGRRAYEDRTKVFAKYELHRNIRIHRVSSTGFGKATLAGRIIDGISFQFMLMVKLLSLPSQDVTICFTSPPLIGLFGLAFRALKGGKVVQWLMDVNPETAIAVGFLKKDRPITRALMFLYRRTLHASDRIVVLDRWMQQRVRSHGIALEKTVIIPPWPIQPLQPSTVDAKRNLANPFRAQQGLGKEFVVMYSGNHSIVHPLDTLLEAALLMRERKDVRFVFFGGGLRVKDVTEFAARHELKNILQLPFQPREALPTLLDLAGLHVVVQGEAVSGLVHPSKIYGVLASGKPHVSIAPKTSILADILEQCPHGARVEHGDAKGLVKKIEEAQALSEARQKEIAQACFAFVSRNFAADRILRKVQDEVLTVAQSPSVAARPGKKVA